LGRKLYVGNLNYDIANNDLQRMFSAHGPVVSAQVIVDRESGRSKGFGFVEMGSDEAAQAAIAALNGTMYAGRNLTVSEARQQENRGGGSRGGGAFGRGRGAFGGGRPGGGRGGGGGRGDRY
jgi:RNA recognition motif-containing protein